MNNECLVLLRHPFCFHRIGVSFGDPSSGFSGIVMAETRRYCLKNDCAGVKKWNRDMKTSFFC